MFLVENGDPATVYRNRLVDVTRFQRQDFEMIFEDFGMSTDRCVREARNILPPLVSAARFSEIRRNQFELLAKAIQADLGKRFGQPLPYYITNGLMLSLTGLIDISECHQVFDVANPMDGSIPRLGKFYLDTAYKRIFAKKYSHATPSSKLVDIDKLPTFVRELVSKGKRVVTTYGKFDFHGDHELVLEEAREIAAGGTVVALLSSDEEIGKDYGSEPLEARLRKVAGSGAVDIVSPISWDLVSSSEGIVSPVRYRELMMGIGAHIRHVGEVDHMVSTIFEQSFAAGTVLTYGSNTQRGIHSSRLKGEK